MRDKGIHQQENPFLHLAIVKSKNSPSFLHFHYLKSGESTITVACCSVFRSSFVLVIFKNTSLFGDVPRVMLQATVACGNVGVRPRQVSGDTREKAQILKKETAKWFEFALYIKCLVSVPSLKVGSYDRKYTGGLRQGGLGKSVPTQRSHFVSPWVEALFLLGQLFFKLL
jgi:hypothetical protein